MEIEAGPAVVRQMREAGGLTQKQLAARLNVAEWTVQSWERGRREPGWGTILAIAGIVGAAIVLTRNGGGMPR